MTKDAIVAEQLLELRVFTTTKRPGEIVLQFTTDNGVRHMLIARAELGILAERLTADARILNSKYEGLLQ